MAEFINKYIIGLLLPPFLIAAGIFFGFRLKWFHLLSPIKTLKVILHKPERGGVSPFAAVCTALAGTLGVGNIVGVASAITLGGFGAIFWMWVSATAAAILKYAEITLACAHKIKDENGNVHGGAMYYIKEFFVSRGKNAAAGILSVTFASLCIVDSITMGCVIQINTVAGALGGTFGISPGVVGCVICAAVLIITLSGSKSVYKICEYLVPIMSLGYLLLSAAAIILRYDRVIPAFGLIFKDAFGINSAAGGIFGFFLSRGLRFGCMRGLMTNEAGSGTATIAHSAGNAKYPAEQGVWGIFEVFVDTLLLCTLTAIVIIVSYDEVAPISDGGIMLTLNAYSSVLGDFAGVFMTVAVLFFGFATILCFSYYGLECVRFITKSKKATGFFTVAFSAGIIIGATAAPEAVFGAADIAVGIMTLFNVFILLMMNKEVLRLSKGVTVPG